MSSSFRSLASAKISFLKLPVSKGIVPILFKDEPKIRPVYTWLNGSLPGAVT